jgi:hypothetical protein
MTQDAQLKIVHQTECSRNMMQYAVGCEYIQIDEGGG